MKTIIQTLLVLSITFALVSFHLPDNWLKAGSHPKAYDMGIDKGAGPEGKNAATIKSTIKKIDGFGTLMQMCLADKYAGKRVRMSALVKSRDVEEWAGLWFRVDHATNGPLAFDNMKNRSIKGTTDWKRYDIVLDVPEKAYRLAYGALIAGTGQIWFTNIQFEIVDSSVPVTDMEIEEKPLGEPSNLSFDK